MPLSIKTFVEDKSIKLPRFQRKKTWKVEQNFLLAISVFKKYPIGVCILNEEKAMNSNRTVKYLLDGRQRRNALSIMFQDPEAIYYWAKQYVKFKTTDTPQDVWYAVYKVISDYIEVDSDVTRTSEDISAFDNPDYILSGNSQSEIDHAHHESMNEEGINVLLKLIQYAHTGSDTKNTGLTNVFNFSQHFTKLPYYDSKTKKIDCKALKRVLDAYYAYCSDRDIDYLVQTSFVRYLEENYDYISDAKRTSFQMKIQTGWEDIKNRILILYDISQIISDAEIGVIQVSDITPSDQQKIFDLINSKGTKLTPAEVLSAKPSWNVSIQNPSASLVEETKKLYTFIEIEYTGVVKWDVAATFANRLKKYEMFFNSFDEKSLPIFEKNVGLGFKLLAGIFENGVRQEDIKELSIKESINWVTSIDGIISDLLDMFRVISESDYFKFYKSWKKNIMQLLSDGVGINFILYMYKYWKNIGSPTANTSNVKHFQKNAFVFFDRMIYEYLMDQWKGSSDAKIAKYLATVPRIKTNFVPVESEKWIDIIEKLVNDCKLNDSFVDSHTKITPILYHYYCIANQAGPDTLDGIEVDHIMPQSLFDESRYPNKEYLKHNITNLALLPKKENISKGNKKLIEINNIWLKQQIFKYESILETDFSKYSNLNNFEDLRTSRSKLFLDCFSNSRNDILNN